MHKASDIISRPRMCNEDSRHGSKNGLPHRFVKIMRYLSSRSHPVLVKPQLTSLRNNGLKIIGARNTYELKSFRTKYVSKMTCNRQAFQTQTEEAA